jgi:MoxR-like ATPase
LILAAKIQAILDHRYHVASDDLRTVAPHVLRHRLILNFEGQADGITADDVLDDVLHRTPHPASAPR